MRLTTDARSADRHSMLESIVCASCLRLRWTPWHGLFVMIGLCPGKRGWTV